MLVECGPSSEVQFDQPEENCDYSLVRKLVGSSHSAQTLALFARRRHPVFLELLR
jgi:hypothetical protein